VQKYQNSIQDLKGNAVAGASIAVYIFGTASLATIYSDNGVTVIAPGALLSDAEGEFAFYAVNGRYNVQVVAAGLASQTTYDVLLFDPADAGIVSVKDFGAVGDGVTNDTAAINLALSTTYTTGQALCIPAGTYLYDGGGSLGNGNIIYGEGRNATIIRSRLASPTGGYIIHALGYGSGVRGIRFDAAVAQTSGCYVWLSGPETFIEDFYMTGDFNGVWMTGSVSRIRHGRFQDGATGAIRIKAEGGDNSQLIDDVLMGAQSPQVSTAGIRVRNSSALIISNTSVIQQGNAVLIDPYTSVVGTNLVNTDKGNVFSLYANNCFFDNSSGNALRIVPSGTGSVVRSRFANCWFGSSSSDGAYLTNTSSGILQGIYFDSCHFPLNTGSGITTGGVVSDIELVGGFLCQNSYGAYFGGSTSKITVTGCTIGAGAGLNGNTNNGIVLEAGTASILIANNQMQSNGSSAISDSSTSTDKAIYNNIGSTLQKMNGGLDISSATGGQIAFPATQNPSTDVNTLDDYEEGTWTPALTFAVPGNLSITYTSAVGAYTKIGRMVTLRFQIVTSAFTHTTASGNATITGIPFASAAGFDSVGAAWVGGITKASYTQFVLSAAAATSTLIMRASGSGQVSSSVTAADMPTGGTVEIRGTITYFV
jgi:hypothetical protein